MDRLILIATVAAFVICVTPMPAPAKPSAKAVSRPVPMQPMICQGSIAHINSTTMAGDNRSEGQVAFIMKMNSPREAMIVGVDGTTVIKPGKYLASRSSNGVSLDFNWTDSRNNHRMMTVTFDRDGSFHGSTDAMVVTTPGQEMTCGLIDAFLGSSGSCEITRHTSSVELSGVCMEQ